MVKVIDVRSLDFNLSTSILEPLHFSHQCIGVGSNTTLGGGQSQRGQLQYLRGIVKCTQTHACTRMYMLLNVPTPMHACIYKCMHVDAYARMHLYIYILI